MTVNTRKPVSGPYPANGVKKDWPFEFKIRDITHMSLVINNDDGSGSVTVTSDFTIDEAYINNDTGGYVIYPASGAALPVGKSVFAVRVIPYSQPTRIGNQGRFWPQTHEDTFDLLAMQIQQIAEEQSRALSVGVGIDPPDIDSIFASEINAAASAAQALASKNAAGVSEVNAAASAAQALASKNAAGVSEVNAANSNASAGAYAAEALGYRNTAVAASVSADADATQTGLDRAQTGADRVQTGLDRIQTGIDAANAAASAEAAETFDPANYVAKTGLQTMVGPLQIIADNNAFLDLRGGPGNAAIIDFSAAGNTDDYDWRQYVDAANSRMNFLYKGGSSGFISPDGNMWTNAYGWFHERFAQRLSECQHNSNIVEFSGYDTGITDSVGRASNPYVMIGIRRGNTGSGNASFVQAVTIRNN